MTIVMIIGGVFENTQLIISRFNYVDKNIICLQLTACVAFAPDVVQEGILEKLPQFLCSD